MKIIHLIRHAKSSWDDASLADIDRPLNRRGMTTCGFMAQHIRSAGCCFEHVFCSPAVRAQSTIELINTSIKDQDIEWRIVNDLYVFDGASILAWCRTLPESISEAVIIGHNPALTDFCNDLSDGNIRNIPTCGYAQLAVTKDSSWQRLTTGSAELIKFLRPKKLLKKCHQ